MFTNTPPPLHAPQAAAQLNEGARTFVTASVSINAAQSPPKLYIIRGNGSLRSTPRFSSKMDAPTPVTPAATPQATQSVKWKAHKKLRNENAIAVMQAAIQLVPPKHLLEPEAGET